MQNVKYDVWCKMCDVPVLIFVRSWFYESRGDHKFPIWVIFYLLSDIPKLIPGSICMYTISCMAPSMPERKRWLESKVPSMKKEFEVPRMKKRSKVPSMKEGAAVDTHRKIEVEKAHMSTRLFNNLWTCLWKPRPVQLFCVKHSLWIFVLACTSFKLGRFFYWACKADREKYHKYGLWPLSATVKPSHH